MDNTLQGYGVKIQVRRLLEKNQGIVKGAILYLFILFYLCYLSAECLSAHITPDGDFAADMLLGDQLRNTGYLLVGHYSRWGFNHPGPFWFYLNRVFELALGWTDLSRFQIWQIGAVLSNSVFLWFSAAAFSRLLLKRLDLFFALAFAMIFIGFSGGLFSGIWMPSRIVVPYVAFLICILHLSYGNNSYLGWAVFFTCILVHGYATMPAFTIPFLMAALLHARVLHYCPWLDRRTKYQLLFSAVLIVVFVSPLLIDFLFFDPSNISRMITVQDGFHYLPKPDWHEMRELVWSLFLNDKAEGWWIALPFYAALLFLNRFGIRRRSVVATFVLCILVTLFVFLYYKHTPSPVHSFVALFYTGIPVLVLSAIVSLAFRKDEGERMVGKCESRTTLLQRYLLVPVVMLAFVFPLKMIPPPGSGQYVTELADVLQDDSQGRQIRIDYEEYDQWTVVDGILLELDRRGVGSCTTWRSMRSLYTDARICEIGEFPEYRLVSSSRCQDRCFAQAGGYGVQRVRREYVSPGGTIEFRDNGVLFEHWDLPEEKFRWSLGKSAEIVFLVHDPRDFHGEMILQMETLGNQHVEILLNGRKIYSSDVRLRGGSLTIPYPVSALRAGRNFLNFRLPNAHRPNDRDARILAVALTSVQIR